MIKGRAQQEPANTLAAEFGQNAHTKNAAMNMRGQHFRKDVAPTNDLVCNKRYYLCVTPPYVFRDELLHLLKRRRFKHGKVFAFARHSIEDVPEPDDMFSSNRNDGHVHGVQIPNSMILAAFVADRCLRSLANMALHHVPSTMMKSASAMALRMALAA